MQPPVSGFDALKRLSATMPCHEDGVLQKGGNMSCVICCGFVRSGFECPDGAGDFRCCKTM